MSRSFTLVTRTDTELVYVPFTHQDTTQDAIEAVLAQYPDAPWILDRETGSLMYKLTE